MRNKKTKKMVVFSMLLAIEVILSFTPIGFLRVGFLSITMLHIPVIICAMALGKRYGAALGFVMGFCSFYNATFQPTDHQLLLHSVFFHGRRAGKLDEPADCLCTAHRAGLRQRAGSMKSCLNKNENAAAADCRRSFRSG